MKITIETIDHSKQRYETAGDWTIDHDKQELKIYVSNMGNWRYEALVGIHELCEVLLCLERHISQESVDAFDMAYEEDRKEGDNSEPGDDAMAPYRREHFFATNVERMLCAEFDIVWKDYDQAVNSL